MKTFTIKGQKYRAHPAADLWPMLPPDELQGLAADIAKNGQAVRVVLTSDGFVLDGRNRLAACELAGVEPDTEFWDREDDDVSPTEWVLSLNKHRRHLNPSQLAVVAAQALPLLEAEAKQRQKAAGGDKRLAPRGAKRCQATDEYELQCTLDQHSGPHVYPPKPKGAKSLDRPMKGKASEVAAKAVGASARQVERAKAVITKRPELVEQIKAGRTTLKQAEKAIKREEQHKQVLEYRPPKGTYSVIATDVPWRYDDELDGSDQARSGVQYPTMSVDEICDMNVGKNFAAPDCALWFWVTTAFLIDGTAARVLAAWGFEPKTMLTWVKDRFGAGRYLRNQTEHCILAVRGKPMITGEAVANVLNAPRRGHSEKPDEFFSLVEKVCPARDRLELFARKQRDGWVTSGAELPAVSKKAGAREPVLPPEPELPPELAAHWGRVGDAFVCVMSGTKYTVRQTESSTLWEFSRKGHAGGGFTTAEHAMREAEAHEDGLEPQLDAEMCGDQDGKPGPKNPSCFHGRGHSGAHSNGYRTWPAKKKRRLPPIVDVPSEA